MGNISTRRASAQGNLIAEEEVGQAARAVIFYGGRVLVHLRRGHEALDRLPLQLGEGLVELRELGGRLAVLATLHELLHFTDGLRPPQAATSTQHL